MSEGRSDAKAMGADDYDDMWSRLEDFLRYNPGARHRRRLIIDALQRNASRATTILDVGCGVGETIAFLEPRFPASRFTGVDLSPLAIESCRTRFPAHRWEVVDIIDGELPGPVDAIVCSELLEHLDDPARALARISTALEPGGIIVVTVPNGKVFATERAVGHVRHPTIADLREWFAAADLDVIESRRWGWPGYLALKYAANVNPERALSTFGSGKYSWSMKRANDVAYAAVGVGSLRDHARGPQTVMVGRRRAAR